MYRTLKHLKYLIIYVVIASVILFVIPCKNTDFIGFLYTVAVFILFPLIVITLVRVILDVIDDIQLLANDIKIFDNYCEKKQNKKKKQNVKVADEVLGEKIEELSNGVASEVSEFTSDDYLKYPGGIELCGKFENISMEDIYQDFKEYNTVFGSVYHGKTTMDKPALYWGEMDLGDVYYLYKSENGGGTCIGKAPEIGYKRDDDPIYSEYDQNLIKNQAEKQIEPKIEKLMDKPIDKQFENNLDIAISNGMQKRNFVEDLGMVVHNYYKNGKILPMPEYNQGKVYIFRQQGEKDKDKVDILDTSNNLFGHLDRRFSKAKLYDKSGNEIFKIKKLLMHTTSHYFMYRKGKLQGEIFEKIAWAGNFYYMQTRDGVLKITTGNSLMGNSYNVIFNNEKIGLITENLLYFYENQDYFDTVIRVYKEEYLELMLGVTAMLYKEKI